MEYFTQDLRMLEILQKESASNLMQYYGIRDWCEAPSLILQQSDYYRNFNILTPVSFLKCASIHLKLDFEKKTGIKVTKHNAMLLAPNQHNSYGDGLGYVMGETSYMNQELLVNNWVLMVIIAWKSKSGRIYKITDEDINCNDVEMWFHDLNVAEVYKKLYPKLEAPMKIKGLNYDLQVLNMDINQTLELHFKEGLDKREIENIVRKIDNYIATLNDKSEKKDRQDGVIHNWGTETVEPSLVVYTIDMGSAGYKFFKSLLKYISDLNCLQKAVMC